MKQLLLSLMSVLALAGILRAQAGSTPQTPATPPPGTSTEQKKADESQCMKWAKQQAGLTQPESAQQPSAAGQPAAGGQPSAAGQPAAGGQPSAAGHPTAGGQPSAAGQPAA